MNQTLSIDFLRTFAAIADAGTFAAAAERVGRTVSAVSLQIDRLEEQVGRALFQKFGRRMETTSAGRQLLDHARTILAANDAALSAMSSDRLSGTVRLGVMHDGIEAAATTVLADFMTTHPEARIEVVVDTSQALIDAMEAGKLDQAIAFQVNTRLPRDTLGLVPMRWIGNRQRSLIDERPLPLVMLEEPCAFRRGPRTDALDRQPAAESHRRAPVAACDAGGAVRLPPGGCCSARRGWHPLAHRARQREPRGGACCRRRRAGDHRAHRRVHSVARRRRA